MMLNRIWTVLLLYWTTNLLSGEIRLWAAAGGVVALCCLTASVIITYGVWVSCAARWRGLIYAGVSLVIMLYGASAYRSLNSAESAAIHVLGSCLMIAFILNNNDDFRKRVKARIIALKPKMPAFARPVMGGAL